MSTPVVVNVGGAPYVSIEALRVGLNDPLLIANAVALLKVGIENGKSLADCLSVATASFVTHVTGQMEPIPFTPEQIAELGHTINRSAVLVAAEIIERRQPQRN